MAIDQSTHNWQEHALRAQREIKALEAERDRWYGKAIKRAGWRQCAAWSNQRIRTLELILTNILHQSTALRVGGPDPMDLHDLHEALETSVREAQAALAATPEQRNDDEQHSEGNASLTAAYMAGKIDGRRGAEQPPEKRGQDEALTALNELVDAAMSDDDIGRDERVSVYDAVFRRRDCIRRALRQRLLSHRWVERIPTLLRNIEKADDVVLQSWQGDRPLTRETQRFIRSALQESHAVIIEIQRAAGGDND